MGLSKAEALEGYDPKGLLEKLMIEFKYLNLFSQPHSSEGIVRNIDYTEVSRIKRGKVNVDAISEKNDSSDPLTSWDQGDNDEGDEAQYFLKTDRDQTETGTLGSSPQLTSAFIKMLLEWLRNPDFGTGISAVAQTTQHTGTPQTQQLGRTTTEATNVSANQAGTTSTTSTGKGVLTIEFPLKSIMQCCGGTGDDGGDEEHQGSKRPREHEVTKEKKNKKANAAEIERSSDFLKSPSGNDLHPMPDPSQSPSTVSPVPSRHGEGKEIDLDTELRSREELLKKIQASPQPTADNELLVPHNFKYADKNITLVMESEKSTGREKKKMEFPSATFDISDMAASDAVKLNQATAQVIQAKVDEHTALLERMRRQIDEKDAEIKEYKNALCAEPLYAGPTTIRSPVEPATLPPETEIGNKTELAKTALSSIRKVIVDNLGNKESLLKNTWELANRAQELNRSISVIRGQLELELQNDNDFEEHYVRPYMNAVEKVDYTIREAQQWPNDIQLIEIRRGWSYRIRLLTQLVTDCNKLEENRVGLGSKLDENVQNLAGPMLMHEGKLRSSDDFNNEVTKIKENFGKEYYSKNKITDEDIRKWVTDAAVINSKVGSALEIEDMELYNIENSLLEIKVKKNTTVGPFREDIRTTVDHIRVSAQQSQPPPP